MLSETIAACRHWSAEFDSDGICWLCIDKQDSPVNVLSRGVLEEFESIIAATRAAPPAGLIIFSGKDNGFIAGADINEFPNMTSAEEVRKLVRRGQQCLNALEDLSCPTIAAIDGFALGGGCELAMACDIVLAGPKAKFGQPEVKLGVIPGFGGTQRLVRRVGETVALDLCLTGRMMDAPSVR